MSTDSEPTGCFARIVWFLFGPMALLVLALMIAEKRGGWLGLSSIAFLVILVVTVVTRWVDLRGGNSLTAEGKPATVADVRRFTAISLIVGMAVWCAANVIGQR